MLTDSFVKGNLVPPLARLLPAGFDPGEGNSEDREAEAVRALQFKKHNFFLFFSEILTPALSVYHFQTLISKCAQFLANSEQFRPTSR